MHSNFQKNFQQCFEEVDKHELNVKPAKTLVIIQYTNWKGTR